MNGSYEEQLTTVGFGTFKVSASEWHIRYYFPGPDARHKGTWLNIKGEDVPAYIEAYKANWKEYQELKDKIPHGGSFRKLGVKNMAINIGPGVFRDGVYIDGWNIPINNISNLEALISSFEICMEKSKKIMLWLKNS